MDLPIENGGSFHSYVSLPEGNIQWSPFYVPFRALFSWQTLRPLMHQHKYPPKKTCLRQHFQPRPCQFPLPESCLSYQSKVSGGIVHKKKLFQWCVKNPKMLAQSPQNSHSWNSSENTDKPWDLGIPNFETSHLWITYIYITTFPYSWWLKSPPKIMVKNSQPHPTGSIPSVQRV